MSEHPFIKIVRDPAEAVAFRNWEQAAMAVADVARFPTSEGATLANSYRIELVTRQGAGIVVALIWPNDAAPYYFAQRL